MKKSILVMAVAASMVASTAAVAEPKVYGNIHLSINAADNDVPNADNNIKMSSNTSSLGVKGSEDLGDGLKAIYKAEWEIDIAGDPTATPDAGNPKTSGSGLLTGRDQFVGLKGGFGAVKVGTMSSNYKQMGGKVDAFYRTPVEGRGLIKTQSSMHGGRGNINGRQTNTLQYVSPKMGGIQLVANTTFTGNNDETSGIGLRWSNKAFLVYADWISGPTADTLTCTAPACDTESAAKLGGKFHTKAFSVALQYEAAEDRVGADYIHAQGTFNINKNNMIGLTYGIQDRKELSVGGAPALANDSTGLAVAYNHKMSKMTNVYVAYGARSEDQDNRDESMLSFGIRKKF
ncbi:MAG: porin [Proteobacteria bacterium]|nr:porin [Pseudomonadota bacterium]